MNMADKIALGTSKIATGDWVGQMWDGPHWTPYASAIADHYPIQVPWFSTFDVDLPANVGLIPGQRTIVTRPNKHDILIFGAHIRGLNSHAPVIGVQVTHQESGVPWAVNNVVPYIPLTAFGGLNNNATALFRWPEAFFLPRNSKLKFNFTSLDTTGGFNPGPMTITLAGVQLVRNGPAPKTITMPNGKEIRIDSRLPNWLTMGLGRRDPITRAWTFDPNTQTIQFLPPIECDTEIHDLNTNVLSDQVASNIAESVNISVKLTVMGVEGGWTPYLSPLTAVFGGPGGGAGGTQQIFIALPFNKPYLLPKGHRIQIAMQNNNAVRIFTHNFLTFRGVRRCEY